MDAFFASVEVQDAPALRGKPVIVAGRAEERGVVSAASYEARVYGVHSAMPTARAKRLCPQGVFLRPRGERYAEVSRAVREVLHRFTPLVEPVSVDEAFLDVTGSQRLFGPPARIARSVKRAVREATGLVASVGAAPSKFVAKLASDLDKPDGLVVIPPDQVAARLGPLPVSRLWGVGGHTLEALAAVGIRTIADLRAWPREALARRFGQAGEHLHALACGQDPRAVTLDRETKSVSHETTFARDVCDVDALVPVVTELADRVAGRLRAAGLAGGVVFVKLRYQDFQTVTRRRKVSPPTDLGREITRAALDLLHRRTEAGARPVRLVGVGVMDLECGGGEQRSLFADGARAREEVLEGLADRIRARYGRGAMVRGSTLRASEGSERSAQKKDA